MNVVDAQLNDDISHPAHYTHSAIECIEIAEQLSFNLGAALKYVWRYKHKGTPAKDLRKAAWFLRREAERCRKIWVGARVWQWWKLQRVKSKYAGFIPCEPGYTLHSMAVGNLKDEALWLEGLAATYE